MRTVIKIKDGEAIPKNANYLTTKVEPDYSQTKKWWEPSPGLKGLVFETLYVSTPSATFHYYEVTND